MLELYTNPEEPFPHNPEPLSENIHALCTRIRETGADIGFAQDADADRLAIVDELANLSAKTVQSRWRCAMSRC